MGGGCSTGGGAVTARRRRRSARAPAGQRFAVHVSVAVWRVDDTSESSQELHPDAGWGISSGRQQACTFISIARKWRPHSCVRLFLSPESACLEGLVQLTWSNSSKWARLPGFAQSGTRLPGFAKFWTRLPGPLNLHRARLPGSSNSRVRLPGFAKLWTRLPGKRNVRTRLPRPQLCKSGPGYLVGQITWSRPKVGQITWSRPAGRREMVFGRPACFWPL